jgi:Ran GTPase-activating protein (RanGAP) involved in mRNA processing and transport
MAVNLEKVNLKSNKIQANGLQMIASALAHDESKVRHLDIQDNIIPDFNLKILLAMLYNNRSMEKIDYTISDPVNIERKKAFDK